MPVIGVRFLFFEEEPGLSRREARLTVAEEIANSLTHGLGLGLGIAALVFLVLTAARHGTAISVTSAAIYGATLVILYAASTLYHALPKGRAKTVFGVLDHCAIFLLIAGTYTPFTLVGLRGGWGWSLFGVIWSLAVVGIVAEAVTAGRARRLQVMLYLAMGWMAVIAIGPMFSSLSAGALWFLFGGGVAYSLGVIFYRWHSLKYHHAVWHVFVLAGSALHVVAVMVFILPAG